VLIVNRDEFLERPTLPAHWWSDLPVVLGGRDIKVPWPSTQFGVTKTGRFAAITNFRRGPPEEKRSRGQLAVDFLTSAATPSDFVQTLVPLLDEFDGFNLICGTPDSIFYVSNRDAGREPRELECGRIYGLSNAGLDSTWPKVLLGKQLFELTVDRRDHERFYAILNDRKPVPDELVQVTGWGLETERCMANIFVPPFDIDGRLFGTRAQHIFTVDDEQHVTFTERFRQPQGAWTDQKFEFRIEPSS